ncbi:MAG: hypothetical protein ABR613_07030 [Actinomycetota bacterium]
MGPGKICIAGLEVTSRAPIRPIAAGGLPTTLLSVEGGVFALGNVVDLGPAMDVGSAPEVEDRLVDLANLAAVGRLEAREFWRLLTETGETNLTNIFGPDLQARGHERFVNRHQGTASLGHLAPAEPPEVYVSDWDKVRVVLPGEGGADLSLTDRRFVEPNHKTPRYERVEAAREFLQGSRKPVLSVGLARAWEKPGDTQERHYLQVNNIHFEQDPLWERRG